MQFEVDMMAPGVERIIGTDHTLEVNAASKAYASMRREISLRAAVGKKMARARASMCLRQRARCSNRIPLPATCRCAAPSAMPISVVCI